METVLEKNKNILKEESEKKPKKISEDFGIEKKQKMDNLERKLKELDEKGNDLRWEDLKNRIILQYDEKAEDEKKFSCVYNDKEYKLTLGDIMADYNWGLKYMPDRDMPDNAYRQISKKILTNETRRDIEKIYDEELAIKARGRKSGIQSNIPGPAGQHKIIQSKIEQGEIVRSADLGIISEMMVREFMTRLSHLSKLDFIIKIQRPTIEEDVEKKIDFKIIVVIYKRGVKTTDEENMEKATHQIQRLGFQMVSRTSTSRLFQKKEKQIADVKDKYKFGIDIDVDDIVLIGINMRKTRVCYTRWLSEQRPPGGPEQYLSNDKKREIFRVITQKLGVDISDGELEKIFKT